MKLKDTKLNKLAINFCCGQGFEVGVKASRKLGRITVHDIVSNLPVSHCETLCIKGILGLRKVERVYFKD